MAGFPAVIDLAALGSATGFRIDGPAASSYFGWSAASAGDVNGDGIADFIIGARLADAGGANSGAAYVVFGTAAGFPLGLGLAGLDGSNGFVIRGAAAQAGLGGGVAGVDVDGDGYSDLIVTAPYADPNGAGAVYVIHGKASGFGAVVTVGAGADSRLDGEGVQDHIGQHVTAAGDYNGDGLEDFLVSSETAYRQGASNSGVAYLVFGDEDGLPASLNLFSLNGSNGFEISGAGPGAHLGGAIAGGLDINGDGFADLMVSASAAPFATEYGYSRAYSGSVYVLYGSASPPAAADLSAGGGGFRIVGGNFASLGFTASSGSDFNGDGRDDLIFFNGGSVQVLYGGAYAGVIDLMGPLHNGFTLIGAPSQVRVTAGGDVNGDGHGDLIVSSSAINNGMGGAFVILGGEALFGAVSLDSLLTSGRAFQIVGSTSGEGFGGTVDFIGDINGDGADEMAFGAARAGYAGVDSGSTYVIWGQPVRVMHAGLAGDEIVDGGDLDDQLSGLGGKDTLSGLAGDDRLDGGDANDTLIGGIGADDILGGAGNDWLQGDGGDDQLTAGDGADKLFGGLGADTMVGGAGNDRMDGGDGVDVMTGEGGNDYLDGGTGGDLMTGGDGNEVYVVDDAADQTIEAANEGFDIVRTSLDGWVLAANLEGLELQGIADIGGTGNGGANNLQGNAGGNQLDGGAGVDTINGNDGDDIVIGGLGNDLLRGGLGGDTFVVAHAFGPVLETDQVYDFSTAEGDVIDLSGAWGGVLSLVGAFGKHAGEMTLSLVGGNTVLKLDITGDGKADYQMKINGDVTADSGGWLL
ncbi:MAG: Hemolysin-type calcium-binding region [Caulobacter sp.]|nr:Hemolysin-type calcium-binding region [Caulobacter sp.]